MTVQLSRLLPHECRILALACEGYSTRQIAELLHLSVEGADAGLDAIAMKMGLSNYVVLIAFAREYGLCETSCEPWQERRAA
jgi:DNA-binding CsgD family transcriptional regulator